MLIAALVLLGLAVSATKMSQLTNIRLTQAVDRNWRGAYDILVTPRSHETTRSAAATSGLIEPDFLAYGGHGGISFAQLNAIRNTPGVAVAAPVSTIGYVVSDAVAPHIFVSRKRLPRAPTLYRLSLRVTTSDGLHTFTVSRQTMTILLGPSELTGRVPFVNSDGAFGWDPSGVDLAFGFLPPQVTPVIAVDPKAEQRLFGSSFHFLTRLSIPAEKLRLGNFDASLISPRFALAASELGALQDAAARGGNAAASAGDVSLREPVVPIVVSDHLAYPLRLTVEIDRKGRHLAAYPRPQPVAEEIRTIEREVGGGSKRIGRVSVDVGGQLRAFEPASLTLLWPGSSRPGNSYLTHSESRLDTELAERATYTPGSLPSGPAYRIKPRGLVGWDGEPASRTESRVESYRAFTSVPLAVARGTAPPSSDSGAPRQAFFLAPVGVFDFGMLHLPANQLNHVPLGAYEPATGLLLPARPGQQGRTLTPTENPLGFLTGPPEVMTSISEAKLLRGSAPIDAVRVRVGGISTFDAHARDTVTGVASRIADLGLDARVVAGSSPRVVDVYVPKYLPSGRDLGWVAEDWTSLGAAQAAHRALSGAEKALLLLSGVVAILLAATVSSVGIGGAARDAGIWRTLGWSSRRILWWLISDSTIGALGVITAAVVAGALARGGTLVVLGLGLGLVLLGAQVAVAILVLRREIRGARRPSSRLRRCRQPARVARLTAVALAWRAILRQARASAAIAGGCAISALVVAVAAGAVRSGSESASTSLLGMYLNTTLFAFHAASLGLLACGGLAAAAIATQAWQRRRWTEIRAFAAVGLSRSEVLRELRSERVLLAVASLLLAIVGALVLHVVGISVGGAFALPTILILCGSYAAAAELSAKRRVKQWWPD
jgi:hypothetical protein